MKLDRTTKDQFVQRLMALTSESRRLWGSLTVTGMVRHLHRSFEVSLGEVEVPDWGNFLTKTVGKWFVLNIPLPIPRGRIKAPDVFVPEDSGDLDAERKALVDKLDEYLEALERTPDRSAAGFIFGPMTLAEWSRLHGGHWDHHLRQFGV